MSLEPPAPTPFATRAGPRSAQVWPLSGLICGLLLLLIGFALPVSADNAGFFVERAELHPLNGTHAVNADIACQFSPTAIEALMNGVPLTLTVTFSIIRPRRVWPGETLLEEARDIQIRYYPLAESYQILDKKSGASQSFASLSTLLDTLSRIRNWSMPPLDKPLKSGLRYKARLRVTLDIESLPLPLRVQAYISPDWHQKSPTYEWRVNP